MCCQPEIGVEHGTHHFEGVTTHRKVVGNNQGAKPNQCSHRGANTVFEEREDTVDYLVGTMIEVPRAALMADAIALF